MLEIVQLQNADLIKETYSFNLPITSSTLNVIFNNCPNVRGANLDGIQKLFHRFQVDFLIVEFTENILIRKN